MTNYDHETVTRLQRILARANLARRLCQRTARMTNTSPLTVRVDLGR
jgi:hypothetical protein